jgi:hypothetical protein
MSARKKCGSRGCSIKAKPRKLAEAARNRARRSEPAESAYDWPCHNCPEVFSSLRELNEHNYDRATNRSKPCANPHPTPAWYMERFEKLMAEIAELKARIKHANKYVGHLNPTDVNGALDLRKKHWRGA